MMPTTVPAGLAHRIQTFLWRVPSTASGRILSHEIKLCAYASATRSLLVCTANDSVAWWPFPFANSRTRQSLNWDNDMSWTRRLALETMRTTFINNCMATSEDGTIWGVAIEQDHIIKLFTPSGLSCQIGVSGCCSHQLGYLSFPTGMALTRHECYVADTCNQRIQVFGVREGEYRRHWSVPGFPYCLAVSSQGGTVAVTCGNGVAVLFSATGHVLCRLPPVFDTYYNAVALGVHAVWVARRNHIAVFRQTDGVSLGCLPIFNVNRLVVLPTGHLLCLRRESSRWCLLLYQ